MFCICKYHTQKLNICNPSECINQEKYQWLMYSRICNSVEKIKGRFGEQETTTEVPSWLEAGLRLCVVCGTLGKVFLNFVIPWNHSYFAPALALRGQPHGQLREQNSDKPPDHLKPVTSAQIKCPENDKYLSSAQWVQRFCSVWSKDFP